MFKRRFFLLLIAGGVLVVVAAVVFSRPREPEYGGKKLSEWVARQAPSYWAKQPIDIVSNRVVAVRAIRMIGTNAIPYLLKWMRYETPTRKTKLYVNINPTLRRLNA